MVFQDYVIDCTVRIDKGRKVLGTGFFVAKGIILTCYHVINGKQGDDLFATYKGNRYPIGEIRYTDNCATTDLALLMPTALPEDHPILYLLDDIKYGEEYWSYGYTDAYPGGKPGGLINMMDLPWTICGCTSSVSGMS
jgi:hypothetical protein